MRRAIDCYELGHLMSAGIVVDKRCLLLVSNRCELFECSYKAEKSGRVFATRVEHFLSLAFGPIRNSGIK